MSIIYEYNDNMLGFHHSIDKKPVEKNFRMHVHDQYELLYFVSGSGTFTIEGSTYNLTKDCLILMRPAEFHKISVSCDEPYERMVVHFKKEILSGIDSEGILTGVFDDRPMGEGNFYAPEEFGKFDIKRLFEEMKTEGTAVEKQLAVTANLIPILRKLSTLSHTAKKHSPGKRKNEVFSELVYFINRHISDNLSLDILSDHFFLSKSQLNRIFKDMTGTSLWEYVVIKRLMGARNLIHSGVPIIKASQQFGFADYSSFYRAYKKHFGISPKADGKRARNEIIKKEKKQ